MHFSKIELHNYGLYKGTHVVELSDRIDKRNITLVGGLNGRGKTTLHDAVLIVLYERQSLKYIQEKERSYEKMLLERINKQADVPETYLAVTLILDDGTELRVKRSWRRVGEKLDQVLVVEKNGQVDKYLAKNWSYYVEEFLPFGIARFFFFNNEKITQLADDASFEQIKSSIKSAIGINTIEKSMYHLDEVIRRKKNAIEDFEKSELNQDYQDIEAKVKETNQLLAQSTKRVDTLEETFDTLVTKMDVDEANFWASGGNLGRDREAIKQQMKLISEDMEGLQNELIKLASEPSTPLFLCRSLISEVYNAEDQAQENRARRLSESILAKAYERIMQKLEQSNMERGVRRAVEEIINEELKSCMLLQDEPELSELSAVSVMLLEQLISSSFQTIEQRISQLIAKAEQQENEWLSLDAHLGNTGDKTLAMQLYEVLKDLEKQKALAEEELIRERHRKESLAEQRQTLAVKRMALLRAIVQRKNNTDADARDIQYAAASYEFQEKLKVRLQTTKLSRLSETVTACFKTLVEKDSLISEIIIDPKSLDISLRDIDGHELLKTQLSAGEQQMFAISIVWALALTSGYKAPVMIDTPLARLDSAHRANFIHKYLPNASSQVIVLSTDEEVTGRYLDLIRENIVDYYTLHYHDDERCTTISSGYFEEA